MHSWFHIFPTKGNIWWHREIFWLCLLIYKASLLIPKTSTNVSYMQFFTARKRSLRRLCFYTCLSVHRGGGYPSMPCRWYPSMPCRSPRGSPGPHPGGSLGVWPEGGRSPGPHPGGSPGSHPKGSPGSHPRGSPCSHPGGLQVHTWGVCIPACTETDTTSPNGRLLPRAVRILLECILVTSVFIQCVCASFIWGMKQNLNVERVWFWSKIVWYYALLKTYTVMCSRSKLTKKGKFKIYEVPYSFTSMGKAGPVT